MIARVVENDIGKAASRLRNYFRRLQSSNIPFLSLAGSECGRLCVVMTHSALSNTHKTKWLLKTCGIDAQSPDYIACCRRNVQDLARAFYSSQFPDVKVTALGKNVNKIRSFFVEHIDRIDFRLPVPI
jgi:hypothetical protein